MKEFWGMFWAAATNLLSPVNRAVNSADHAMRYVEGEAKMLADEAQVANSGRMKELEAQLDAM